MEINHSEITKRIKTLIQQNKVSEYYVWKNTNIPRASFSMMINNKSPWKLEHLVNIANLFAKSFDWLVFEKEDASYKELESQLKKLKKENRKLKSELGNYRKIVAQVKSLMNQNLKFRKEGA
ncbi:hypothetical protein ACFLSV_02400 [Bacteroidota bacterium]